MARIKGILHYREFCCEYKLGVCLLCPQPKKVIPNVAETSDGNCFPSSCSISLQLPSPVEFLLWIHAGLYPRRSPEAGIDPWINPVFAGSCNFFAGSESPPTSKTRHFIDGSHSTLKYFIFVPQPSLHQEKEAVEHLGREIKLPIDQE